MKSVIVTGAYGGMGYAAVKELVAKGYFVYAIDRAIRDAEDGIMPIAADLTNENDVQRAFETVKSSCEEIYAIVHFAGMYTKPLIYGSISLHTIKALLNKSGQEANDYGLWSSNGGGWKYVVVIFW